ncbi:MAG: hypothetical protein DU489_07005 [Nitrosomonas sp.]|uniref:hypothetical protein n=1 Tax=Nitrosomonas sp. TaxID=42353 RepID=UPI0032EED9DB
MTPKKTIAGLSATAILMGGIDASALDEKPLERIEMVASERVEAKQIGNKVETTLPWKDQAGLKVVYDLGEPTIAEKMKDKRKEEVITETLNTKQPELQRKKDQLLTYKNEVEHTGTSSIKIDGLIISATSTEQRTLIAEQEIWKLDQELAVQDGFKVDILLNERPTTNVFCYDIQGAENYDFFYQPPLTPEEIAEGATRPPEIEGSYAVYHKTLKNHFLGQVNYETGKVMHIPRPQVWELDNEESTKEWADLSYTDKDELCVTVRQEFLDKANYPVRVDPTFGYTTIGGSSQAILDKTNSRTWRLGRVFTASEDGTVTKMSAALKMTSGTQTGTVSLFINKADNYTENANQTQIITAESDLLLTTTATIFDINMSGSIINTIPYILNISGDWEDLSSSIGNVMFDAGSGTHFFRDIINGSGAYTTSKDSPWTPSVYSPSGTSIFSIYTTYTAETPATTTYSCSGGICGGMNIKGGAIIR